MNLEVESGRIVENVAEGDIATLIDGEDFAILGDDQSYMQCAAQGGQPSRYLLEYQEGSVDRHFRALEGPFSLERVVAAFSSYLRGDPAWKQTFAWERVEL